MPRPVRNAAANVSKAANATENAAKWLSYVLSRLAGDGLYFSLVKGEQDGRYKLRIELPEEEPDPNPENEAQG